LTWGGERRAGVEAARTFTRGPVSALQVSASAYRRINPHFKAEDTRLELRGRGERAITSWLRAGAGMRRARVTFAGTRDTHEALGADIAIDTRIDPSFPRNAIYAGFGFERLWFTDGRRTAANRSTTDLRGYVGIGGSVVLAFRAYALTSDTGLPPSEQPMLGGGDTLRGYRAGARAGDNLAAVSAEVRIPVNSPLSVGRFGFTAFVDSGATWNAGERLRDHPLERGIGAGMYFGGGPVIADLAIAWPEQGKPRLHFSLGVTF
jgi:outer membrane protein assembly factor BamA